MSPCCVICRARAVDDKAWLTLATELAALCPPSATAFSVGAVIVGPDGTELARGHSREDDPLDHAEEVALRRAPEDLRGATMYTSLEPCAKRASRPLTCTELILATDIGRVVYAWREPPRFVDHPGTERLTAAGVTVLQIPELAEAARRPNAHLL
jgi:pyrimidine deaminase RibD-like protein